MVLVVAAPYDLMVFLRMSRLPRDWLVLTAGYTLELLSTWKLIRVTMAASCFSLSRKNRFCSCTV